MAVKPLTVGFHETPFLAKLNQENQLGFWFQLNDEERQQVGSPWGPANPQNLNRYSYVLNNPLRYTDPSGHNPAAAAIGAALAAVGITVTGPVLAVLATVFTVASIAVFLSDPGNVAWLDQVIRDGVSDITAFAEDVAEKASAFAAKDEEQKERSPYPPGQRRRYNTKKEAYEAAKRDGNGNAPVNHPDGEHGPHYHPGNGKGKPANHDHYYYPRRRR